jgi:hypothetical protein
MHFHNGIPGPQDEEVRLAYATDCCLMRSANLFRPVNINPLIIETTEERRLFAIGEKNSKHRKELSKMSLSKHTPDDLESDLIHAIWQKQLQYHGR